MQSLSSFHPSTITLYKVMVLTVFLWEKLHFYGKYTALFCGKSSLGLSKWQPLEFNVVLGSMLKILWMLSLAIKRSSVGWNNWGKTEVLPIFTMLTTFQLGIGKAPFLSHLVIPGSDSRKGGSSKSLYLVDSGSWMHAVCKRKFKFQVLPFNSSDRCRGTIVHTKCFELNACVLCFIKMQTRSPFF